MFPLIYQHVCNVRVRFLLGVNTILLVSFFVQYRKFNLCEINVGKQWSFCDRSCKYVQIVLLALFSFNNSTVQCASITLSI